MKKNIIIIVLSLFVVFFFVYSFIKANEADKQNAGAMANLELAEQHRKYAEEMEAAAAAAEKEATIQAAAAIIAQNKSEKLQEALNKCKGI